MYATENAINLYQGTISPLLLAMLEQKLAANQETISLCLAGMGALILQSTCNYLHRNSNSLRFRIQIRLVPLFELRLLDEVLTIFPPALLTMALDNRLKNLTRQFATFYALEKGVVERLFSVASALVFGLLGQYLRQRATQSLSLKGWLDQQKDIIAQAQPTAVLKQLPVLIPAEPAVSRTGSLPPPNRRIWLWLLLLLLLVPLLFSLRNISGLQPIQDDNRDELTYRRLADGKQLHLVQRSVENRLINFIESPEPINEKQGFTLDSLLFDPNSTNLAPGSQVLLRNIVDILRAYPNVEIRLEGYSDRSENQQMDQRLSQDRADAVRMALVKMGISEGRVSAKGYGSVYPLGPTDNENPSDLKHRIDLRIIEK